MSRSMRLLLAVALLGTAMTLANTALPTPTPAHAVTYSPPEWLPLRQSATVGCVLDNCAGPYHGYWAVDFGTDPGAPVHAAGSGTAHIGGTDGTCYPNPPYDKAGRWIWIDHGGGVTTRYLHLSSITITDGQQVTPATQIGTVGNSGSNDPCTYYHLHFEKQVNGVKQDPGTLKACHGSTLVTYSNWNASAGTSVRSDSTTCVNPPSPDTDSDGVKDSADRCKNYKGPANRDGCPLAGDPASACTNFNADKKADVLLAAGNGWKVSYGAAGGWTDLYPSQARVENIAVGDFNGDGKSDVLATRGQGTTGTGGDGGWWIAYGGNGSWTKVFPSGSTMENLLVGDFNGDGKSDMLNTRGYGTEGPAGNGGWWISYGGQWVWTKVLPSQAVAKNLAVGDFNGDGNSDVFNARGTGEYWWMSSAAVGKWTSLLTSQTTMDNIKAGCNQQHQSLVCYPAFSDVNRDHTFCNEIEWASDGGIDTGYPDGTFKPDAADTRAMLASQFYNYSGKPAFTPPAVSPFSDVPTSHPQYKEITWLASTGITTGYADGTFKPTASVNRMSMAAFYYRLAGKPSFTPLGTSPFTDVTTSHPFYKEITWLANTKVTTGYTDGTYRPTSTITRQAMAAFLYRYDAL